MITSAGEKQEITLDRLPRKMLNNHVLVKVDFEPDDGYVMKTDGGLELQLAGCEYNESAHIARYGKVILAPERLSDRFTATFSQYGMDWVTEVEIKPSDVVYFGKMASANAPMIKCNGSVYFVIHYSELILRVRDGVIYPLNGYALLDKVIAKTRSEGLILEFGDYHDKEKGIITHVGRPNDKYFGVYSMDADVSVGDEVYFGGKYFGFVEEKMFASLPSEIGYVQRRWIIAKNK